MSRWDNIQLLWQDLPGKNGAAAEQRSAPQPLAPARTPEPEPQPTVARPPGLVGDLADYFYASAVRPVLEVAVVAALGLLAGIAGRQWNTVGEPAGLNLYLVLLGKTGIGKEAGKRGIARVLSHVRTQVPMVDEFVGPTAFASGQGLMRCLDDRPCFMSILNEFGLTLQKILHPKASTSDVYLKKALHDIWSLSGLGGVAGVTAYSEAERNTKVVQSPSVTIVGESTPGVFFQCLDESHVASGLVPRILVHEYVGNRPARNERAGYPPPDDLVTRVANLAATALDMQNKHHFVQVPMDAEGKSQLDAFDTEVDAIMNGAGDNEPLLQIWNRAHLNAVKLATLLAVGCEHHQPMVSEVDARWAIAFVRRSVRTVLRRFEAGQAGGGDAPKAEAEVRKKVIEFLRMTPEERALPKYGIPQSMRTGALIPHNYLYRRLVAQEVQPFKDKPHMLADTIQNLLKGDVLVQLDKNIAWMKCKTRGAVYGVGDNWK